MNDVSSPADHAPGPQARGMRRVAAQPQWQHWCSATLVVACTAQGAMSQQLPACLHNCTIIPHRTPEVVVAAWCCCLTSFARPKAAAAALPRPGEPVDSRCLPPGGRPGGAAAAPGATPAGAGPQQLQGRARHSAVHSRGRVEAAAARQPVPATRGEGCLLLLLGWGGGGGKGHLNICAAGGLVCLTQHPSCYVNASCLCIRHPPTSVLASPPHG
jgi:hypothetical protein